MKLLKPTLAIALVCAGALSVSLAKEALSKYEEPEYTVAEQLGKKAEIRKYAPRIAAEVLVDKEWDDALNAGFRILAGYIFGKNEASEKVAMTAPVSAQASRSQQSEKIAMTTPVTATKLETSEAESEWKIRFYMPSKYSLDTLPKPTDSRVKIQELPGETYAVIKFSGRSTQKSFSKHLKELESSIAEQGHYKVVGQPINAFYNPPWTLPFMRRNEVLLPIEKISAK